MATNNPVKSTSCLSHYDILQVPSTASWEDIKASYQKLARQLHPDKREKKKQNNDNNNNNATNQEDQNEGHDNIDNDNDEFLALQKAWECLRDDALRKDYDLELATTSHKTMQSKSLATSLEDDWELIEEEDTGDLFYVFTCRCGEEIWLSEQQQQQHSSTKQVVPCTGCSNVYHIEQEPKGKNA
jgi:diphthamide biosynthesis protein 4